LGKIYLKKKQTNSKSSHLLRRVNELVVLCVELTFTEYKHVLEGGRSAVKNTDELVVFNAGQPEPGPETVTALPTTTKGDGKVSVNTDPFKDREFGFVKLIFIVVIAPDNAGLPGKDLVAVGSAQM